ncbi:MAG: hypothetical protein HYX36_13505 [Rhizobiales bacterium]|nr:hypothetical protein [Hyphomicrobiales bacterium]
MNDFPNRHSPRDFLAAATVLDGLQAALDGLWEANDLATMALSNFAFDAYRDAAKVAGITPQDLALKIGFAHLLRDRLKEMGWAPPRHDGD